jgi:hypothetical protein
MVKVEQAIVAGVLLLKFRNGSWRALPIGTELDLLMQVLRTDPAQPRNSGLLRSFARSVPQEDEGALMRLVRDTARSFRSHHASSPTDGTGQPQGDISG